jgi:8-oxo-dGTP pyrophosphatase MutT (NUDIX family)
MNISKPELPKAVCILIRHPEKDMKILGVARRGTTDQWGLPGGAVEENETLIDAAIRELKEETGIDSNKYQLKELYTRTSEPGEDGKAFECTVFIADLSIVYSFNNHEIIGNNKLCGDAGPVAWLDEEDLLRGPFSKYNKVTFEVEKKYRKKKPDMYDIKNLSTDELLRYLERSRYFGGVYDPADDHRGWEIPEAKLKEELALRPHVPNKKEAKEIRRGKAQMHHGKKNKSK